MGKFGKNFSHGLKSKRSVEALFEFCVVRFGLFLEVMMTCDERVGLCFRGGLERIAFSMRFTLAGNKVFQIKTNK